MINLPNLVTIIRILSIPFVVYFLYEPTKEKCFYGAIIFLFAALTDWVDGYMARYMKEVTNLGKFLDPLADKLLVTTALILLLYHKWIPVWAVLIILVREIIVMGLRDIAAVQGDVVPASFTGKIKTFLQMLAIFFLLLHYRYHISEPYYMTLDFHNIGYDLLIIAVIATVWSGIDYIIKLRKYILS
jgi:CDP-diacylglycerol--glycerol-3-phosphate 3-phosphatidyltransferase